MCHYIPCIVGCQRVWWSRRVNRIMKLLLLLLRHTPFRCAATQIKHTVQINTNIQIILNARSFI